MAVWVSSMMPMPMPQWYDISTTPPHYHYHYYHPYPPPLPPFLTHHLPPPPAQPKQVKTAQIWATNLHKAFHLINHFLPSYPIVSIDTEFPGTIHQPSQHHSLLQPSELYHYVTKNVNDLNLIQLGLSLSNHSGQVCGLIFEFNFCDFNIDTDKYSKDSVQLLKRQGIDFQKFRREGIQLSTFAAYFRSSKLVNCPGLTWITFHGTYDYAYLVKILQGQNLPDNLGEFVKKLNSYFGNQVYEIKQMIKNCGSRALHGGLDRVATELGIQRVVGKAHQSGSDSFLTLQTFFKIKNQYMMNANLDSLGSMVDYLFGR